MSEQVETPAVEEQSTVLSEEEVTQVVEGTSEEEVTLPSDEVSFEMPEKFQGKSAEDIARAYLELEKMKAKSSEEEKGGDTTSQEEKSKDDTKDEESSKTTEVIQDYVQEFLEKGELSEESYKALEEQGYTKEQVQDQMDFIKYKQEKTITTILEPLGGGVEKFNEVAVWAKENKSEAEVEAFNKALATAPLEAQRLLLKGLYSEYDSSNSTQEEVLHTNTPQTKPKGVYTTQEEFFKDIGSEEYKNNPKYRQMVEDKLGRSDLF